jgi:hypothetical protein
MQMNEPYAIALANELDTHISSSTALASAKELRNLHNVNKMLNELVLAQSVLIKEIMCNHFDDSTVLNKEIQELVQHITLLTKPAVFYVA